MRVEIPHFRGFGAREARAKVYRMSGAKNVINKRFEHGLDELTGTAYFQITFLSSGWTGRGPGGGDLPLSVWRWAGSIRWRPLRNFVLHMLAPYHPNKRAGINAVIARLG